MHGGKDRRMEIPTMLIFISEAKAKETKHKPDMHKQVLLPGISGLPAYDIFSGPSPKETVLLCVFTK